jgi:hypothetical protein
VRILAAALVAFLLPVAAMAAQEESALAHQGCAALTARVDAEPGTGPVMLRSFDGAGGSGPTDNVALATAAFTYDNALAVIALTACGRLPQAKRIGAALALAATSDRAGEHGRLRNAYRGGVQPNPPPNGPPPNGWWDAKANRWLEDDYQVGTATGNVAWAALALLTLAEATGERPYRDAAVHLANWAVTHAADTRGAGGFTGGIFGGEANPRPLTWKSTEHNVDLEAVFRWLARSGAAGEWSRHAAAARAFVRSQWDEAAGRFLTGTLPDGVTENRNTSGLDAQLWPLLLPDAPPNWRRALAYAERAHGVDGGFSFNDDRSGLWTEGTAQAALSYRVTGQPAKAEKLFGQLAGMVSPGGFLWATREPRVTTGLAIGPDSTTADLFYFRLPHLGATAWAVIAAEGWNPFTGRR